MAIDTAAKRFSMMDFDIPSQPGMLPPSGSVDAATRQTFLWLYGGIATVVSDAWTAVAAATTAFTAVAPATTDWTEVAAAATGWTATSPAS